MTEADKNKLRKLADNIERLQAYEVDHNVVDDVTMYLAEATTLPKLLRELAEKEDGL